MSKYIIGTNEANENIPAWVMLEIENAIDKYEREFGITFDHLEYRDWGDSLNYLCFKMFRRLKNYAFEISGQADVDTEENTVSRFYGIRISLFVDSEEYRDFCFAYDLSGVNNFLEYAETPEFDECIDEIIKNKQLIRDLISKNEKIKDTVWKIVNKDK